MSRTRSVGAALASAVLILLGTAAVGRAQQAGAMEAATAIEDAVAGAITKAERSVVAIARVRRSPSDPTFRLEPRPDPFGRRPPVPATPQPTDPDFVPTSYGTGVVVGRGGLILTAYHVLGEDSDYYVTTSERKVYRAWVKGADPRSDLAVLAIDATDLVPITLGDADRLRKGQFVVALGNPYAIARDGQVSASWGIVANLSRKAPPTPGAADSRAKPTLHHFGTLIQTDAKLNLGTSGGALVNLRGEMVGLVVALAAAAGYESSAGYAVPVDATFRRVIDSLKQGREVEYGFLGIRPVNLTRQEILSGKQGMRIDRVVPGTPAERHGLRPGDRITAVNGQPIHDADGLVLEVGRLPVEATARLQLVRAGRSRVAEVTLAKYPVRGTQIVTNRRPDWRGLRVDYTTAVGDADPRAAAGLAFAGEGVAVSEVKEDSPAQRAGLRRGMLITHVGRTPVRTPQEFREAVAGQRGAVALRLGGEADDPVRTVPPGGQ